MKVRVRDAEGQVLDYLVAKCRGWQDIDMNYPTDWNQGGPIMDREKIDIEWERDMLCAAQWWDGVHHRSIVRCVGPTPLIAAMRCYVVKTLGEEIEIPKELT